MSSEAKRVLVYRGGEAQAAVVRQLVEGFGYDRDLITSVSDFESAVRTLYGANASKEKLLALPGPLRSPSEFWMVVAGAGRNVNFLSEHVVRVCGLNFGVLSADAESVSPALRHQADFVLSERETQNASAMQKAKDAFWRGIVERGREKNVLELAATLKCRPDCIAACDKVNYMIAMSTAGYSESLTITPESPHVI